MQVRLVPGIPDETFRRRFVESFVGDFETVLSAIGMTRTELEQRMRDVGEIRSVEADGEAAGSVWIELRGRTLHLHALILDEEFRGRGIGARVLGLLEDEFAGRADELELGVEEANAAARRLYEKAGFEEARRLPEIGFRILRKRLESAQA